jgi:hypothetical protein
MKKMDNGCEYYYGLIPPCSIEDLLDSLKGDIKSIIIIFDRSRVHYSRTKTSSVTKEASSVMKDVSMDSNEVCT